MNIGSGCRISNKGDLLFGNDLCISANSSIICNEKITIGNNVLISWNVLIMDDDQHSVYYLAEPNTRINTPKRISIGNNVWIGCRSLIIKNTILNDNVIVAAGSTIHGDYNTENCVVTSGRGILKKGVFWKK